MSERNNVFSDDELELAKDRFEDLFIEAVRAFAAYPFAPSASNILTSLEIDRVRTHLLTAKAQVDKLLAELPGTE